MSAIALDKGGGLVLIIIMSPPLPPASVTLFTAWVARHATARHRTTEGGGLQYPPPTNAPHCLWPVSREREGGGRMRFALQNTGALSAATPSHPSSTWLAQSSASVTSKSL